MLPKDADHLCILKTCNVFAARNMGIFKFLMWTNRGRSPNITMDKDQSSELLYLHAKTLQVLDIMSFSVLKSKILYKISYFEYYVYHNISNFECIPKLSVHWMLQIKPHMLSCRLHEANLYAFDAMSQVISFCQVYYIIISTFDHSIC